MPVGFGDHAGELADRFGQRGEALDGGAPRFEHAGGDRGLAEVVEDEDEIGQGFRGVGGDAELSGRDDEVVDKARVGDCLQPSDGFGPSEPMRLGFRLDPVAHADDPVAARLGCRRLDLLRNVGPGQVGPADDARDHGAVSGAGE